MIILGVCGRPISHSASPALHEAGMNSLGIQGSSLRIISDSAGEALNLARDIGLLGLNVTAPFKEEMAGLVSLEGEEARELKAVNTLLFKDGRVLGYNTDVFGITESLRAYHEKLPPDAAAVVLGAGGAAKAACLALRKMKRKFCIVNRSVDKALALGQGFNVEAIGFHDKTCAQRISGARIIISCLSSSVCPFPAEILNSSHVILDCNYKEESEISRAGKKLGAMVIGGEKWLINQSAGSQRIFLGNMPDIKALEAAMAEKGGKKSIALVGLMGSGKSVVAGNLAGKLGCEYCDLDKLTEQSCGRSIADIFEKKGAAFFREEESRRLAALAGKGPHVLACGGGVVIAEKNRRLLSENYRVVWLWADPHVLASRIKNPASRPLLQNSNVQARLQGLLAERKYFYSESADLVIGTDGRDAQQVADRIYEEIC